MCNDVSEVYPLPQARYLKSDSRICTFEPPKRLAHDLEIALNKPSRIFLSNVVAQLTAAW